MGGRSLKAMSSVPSRQESDRSNMQRSGTPGQPRVFADFAWVRAGTRLVSVVTGLPIRSVWPPPRLVEKPAAMVNTERLPARDQQPYVTGVKATVVSTLTFPQTVTT